MKKSLLIAAAVLGLFTSCKKEEKQEPVEKTTIIYYIRLDAVPLENSQSFIKVKYKDQTGSLRDTMFTGRSAWSNSIVVKDFEYGQEASLQIENNFVANGFLVSGRIVDLSGQITTLKEMTSNSPNFTVSTTVKK